MSSLYDQSMNHLTKPLVYAAVTVWDIGEVYQGASLQHFGKLVDGTYHYQYPVGYRALMQVHNKSTRSLEWTLEVQVVDDAPRFQVVCFL